MKLHPNLTSESGNKPFARNKNIVVQDLETEVLIYDLNIDKAFCLNKTSGLVWQFCDGRNSVSDISRLMSRKLKMKVPDELVWLALDLLKKNDLLEISPEFEINFGGLSRREIVKKVGLVSMTVLPLISSIIAPPALMAQSGGPTNLAINSPCSSDAQCQTGNCEFILSPSFLPLNRCCIPDAEFAPGFFFSCVPPSDCVTQASSCCSGMTTIGITCPGGGTAVCSCA
jgi:hypothetical protein